MIDGIIIIISKWIKFYASFKFFIKYCDKKTQLNLKYIHVNL